MGAMLALATRRRFRHSVWHVVATVPVALFVVLHLLAPVAPAPLWGVDVLAYYGPLMTALFLAVLLAALTLPLSTVPAAARRFVLRACLSRWFALVLFLASLPLFWFGRVRVHTLGDSVKWFAIVGNAIGHYRPFRDIPWHNASLDVLGLEFINFQQALDLVVHVGVYAVINACGGNEPRAAYEWVSIVSGGLYLVALWSLAQQLSVSATNRLAVFCFFVSLGTLQLFCGYGESYTLVTLLCVVYLTFAIEVARSRRPLWQAGAILALAVATHMLAVSLVPSLLFLVWSHPRWGAILQRRQVYLPVLVGGGIVGALAYVQFYQGLHLPLLTPDEPGRYALLSLRHAATLGNALLLTGPFGLLWGLLAMLKRAPSSPERRMLGIAALGSALLIAVHDITMGGRDWDLMSFPTLMLAAWGIAWLPDLVDGETTRPLARLVIPVMVLHTLLWIGINASPTRVAQRLEQLLLGDTNQSTHYRAWTLGYHYLNLQRNSDAAEALAVAVAHAPSDALNGQGTRESTYRKFYAGALARSGHRTEALEILRDAYQHQPQPYVGANDIALHWDWARAAFDLTEEAAVMADSATAQRLWNESRSALEWLAEWDDSPDRHQGLATVLDRLGRSDEAIVQRYQAIQPEQNAMELMLDEGDRHLASGHPALAATAYAVLLHGGTAGRDLDAEQCLRVGIRLHKAGDQQQAIVAFRRSLALEPESELVLRNLGWLLILTGAADDAVPHLRHAVGLRATAETMFTLALAYMASGLPDSAAATYARAVDVHGARGGTRVGASANLDWLIAQGIQAQASQAIRDQYWPEP